MIEALIFDLDGTLLKNLPINYEKLYREISRITGAESVQPITAAVAKLDRQKRSEILEIWDGEELAVLQDAAVNEEGIALYRKHSTTPKALVTMQGKAFVQEILKLMGLSFDVIITREYTLDRVKQLENALRRLKAEPESTLFVGNKESDLTAAQTVQCQFLRVGK